MFLTPPKSISYIIVKNSKKHKKHNYVNWDQYTNKEDVEYAQEKQ